MDNLLESFFLCYDNSSDCWKIAGYGNRTTFFAWRNNRTIVFEVFLRCVTIEQLSLLKLIKLM